MTDNELGDWCLQWSCDTEEQCYWSVTKYDVSDYNEMKSNMAEHLLGKNRAIIFVI